MIKMKTQGLPSSRSGSCGEEEPLSLVRTPDSADEKSNCRRGLRYDFSCNEQDLPRSEYSAGAPEAREVL